MTAKACIKRALLAGFCLASLAGCDAEKRQLTLTQRALQARTEALANEFHACPRTADSTYPTLRAQSRCLEFLTPENPEAPEGRQLSLAVMVVPSIRPLPEPDPFVILVGGPGQSATLDGLAVLPVFQRIRQQRDILLIDQRGTGPLSPLDCELASDEALLDLSAELLQQVQTDELRRCLTTLDADPRYYTTDLAVQDLDAIRAHLGYERLNLWGVSYGTRVALTYLKYFPEQTRTIALDGVAPPGVLPLEAAIDGGKALQRVLTLCAQESDCHAAFPELVTHYQALRERYAVPQSLEAPNLTSGQKRSVRFSAETIDSALFQMLYSRETARLIPLTIERLFEGDLSVLGGLAAAASSINVLMHYSVICSEDLPLMDIEQANAADGVFVYEQLVRSRVEACKVWPTRQMPSDFLTPVVSDVPTLIFSASQDPVTPQRWGDQVASTLSRVLHLEAQGIGHGVFAYGCASDLVATLVEQGGLQGIDAGCLADLRERPFFTGLNGSGLP